MINATKMASATSKAEVKAADLEIPHPLIYSADDLVPKDKPLAMNQCSNVTLESDVPGSRRSILDFSVRR